MQIVRNLIPTSTLEDFADQHGLVMEINERSALHFPTGCGMRFYARFAKCEVKDGGILIGASGNGDNEVQSMKNYADQISERLIVIDAYGPNRREIQCPRFA
jgi:hypothetical protein